VVCLLIVSLGGGKGVDTMTVKRRDDAEAGPRCCISFVNPVGCCLVNIREDSTIG
jgi:hypothetical protein